MKQGKIIFRSPELAIVREVSNHYPYWAHWCRHDKSDVVFAVDPVRKSFRAFRKVALIKNEESLLARMISNDQYFDIYVPMRTTVDSGFDD